MLYRLDRNLFSQALSELRARVFTSIMSANFVCSQN